MKNVIFDLGAVLIEWDPTLAFADIFTTREAARAWLERVDFDSWNRFQDGGRSFDDGVAVARAAHGDEARHLEGYLDAYSLTIQTPVPGTWEIAEALLGAGRAAMRSPTGRPRHGRMRWRFIPGETIFNDIVVSGQVKQLKPAAAIYRLLMDRNGLEAKDCIFIDDSMANVEGARAVGMDAIHFTGAEALGRELAARGLL